MMRAIVLSGGGSKGAYEIGVWKALRKLHISYDLVTGTSVGALNAAFMVEGNYFKAKRLWNTLNFGYLFKEKINEEISTKDLVKLYGKNILLHGGMDVENLEKLIKESIHVNRFFQSKIDFGLITVNSKTLTPLEIRKLEIEPEHLHDYLIASATCFPAFKKKQIKKEKYIDGGYYDNLPINLALKMGASEIIAVDLKAIGIKQKIIDENIPITYITPSSPLANMLVFDKMDAKRGMRLGYLDTLKTFSRLEGERFTFKKGQLQKYEEIYQKKIIEYLKALFKKNDDLLQNLLKLTLYKRISSEKNKDFFKTILESLGDLFHLDDTKIYTLEKYNRALIEQLNKEGNTHQKEIKKSFKEEKITKWLNTKWIIIYIYEKLFIAKLDKGNKDLLTIATLVPKELMQAIYLYLIS